MTFSFHRNDFLKVSGASVSGFLASPGTQQSHRRKTKEVAPARTQPLFNMLEFSDYAAT
jgi:hypothetical protein